MSKELRSPMSPNVILPTPLSCAHVVTCAEGVLFDQLKKKRKRSELG